MDKRENAEKFFYDVFQSRLREVYIREVPEGTWNGKTIFQTPFEKLKGKITQAVWRHIHHTIETGG